MTVTQAAAPGLAVTPDNRDVGGATGLTTFDVTTPVEWTAETDAAWLLLVSGPGSGDGQLVVGHYANDTGAERTATITVTGADSMPGSVSVTVTQAPLELAVTPATHEVSGVSGTVYFDVATQADWTVESDAGWAVPVTDAGSGESQLAVNYAFNDTGAERTATISVTGAGTVPGAVEVTVTQAAAPGLVVTPDNRDVGGAAGEATFDLVTPTDWTAASDSPWATLVTESGSGNGQLVVGYAFNDTGAERTATITVTGAGTVPGAVEVTVTQAAAPGLAVTPATRSVGSPAGSTTF
ncbi:MAG: BACON domain-containing protein, partial [Candidatus Hydrogenedentes bacterium]|nr:BACON domain-containing protein [Candidatus Hydrogenedentota bacterium]